MIRALFFVVLFGFMSPAFATNVCEEIIDGSSPNQKISYCFEDTRPTQGEVNVVYYWHGLGDSESAVLAPRLGRVFESIRRKLPQKPMVLVGLSLGSTGVVSDQAGWVFDIGIQSIEQKWFPQMQVRRFLFGESMGGHNSLRLAGERPSAFRALAPLCPAIVDFDVFDDAEIEAYVERHQEYLNEKFFRQVIGLFRQIFPTREIWDRNNPMNLVNLGRYDEIPTFLSVGESDSLGFLEGTLALAQKLAERKAVRVEMVSIRGPHCRWDQDSFVDFMVRQISKP